MRMAWKPKIKLNKKSKRILRNSLLGLFLFMGIILIFRGIEIQPEGNVVSVNRSSFDVKIATIGHLDTANGYQLVSGVRGDRGKIIQLVEDGAKVEKGDVLVRLDPTFFESETLRLTGEIKSYEAMVLYAEQMLKLAKSQADQLAANGRSELANAKQEYERYQDYITELKTLIKQGYEISSEVSLAKRKSNQTLAAFRKSQTDMERVKKESVFKIAQSMADLNKVKSGLETLRASFAEIQIENEKTILRAPASGFAVLHETNTQVDQKRKLRVGDTVWQGQPILYLPDQSSMIIKTQVREMDLHKIAAGLEATVKIDAYPDTQLVGKIENIGILALENSSAADRSFQYNVKLNGIDSRLRPGMTARVFITVGQVLNALTIPVTAIFSENGATASYVYESGKYRIRSIILGKMNEDVAEVISGLSEGDKVSLVKP